MNDLRQILKQQIAELEKNSCYEKSKAKLIALAAANIINSYRTELPNEST